MKILFITTPFPGPQGDLLEVSILHGLRTLLGENCIDYPRKKVMYHDWSETKKEELHGRGFTLYKEPLMDLSLYQRMNAFDIDYVLYGVTNAYGVEENELLNMRASKGVYYLDGHDLYGHAPRLINFEGETVIGVQKTPCFKRELVEEMPDAYTTGFGIPEYQIRAIDTSKKTQLFQKTAPDAALFREVRDVGGSRAHHKFTEEELYYDDLASSWFGLTCKKGGWDCMRHYEILAAGALLLFRDYDKKPPLCSPHALPCYSYGTLQELENLMSRLVKDNEPTQEYLKMLNKQRKWLYNTGTTVARAHHVVQILKEREAGNDL